MCHNNAFKQTFIYCKNASNYLSLDNHIGINQGLSVRANMIKNFIYFLAINENPYHVDG